MTRIPGPQPSVRPFALGLFLPGLSQWSWKQRGRGAVFFGWFASAIAVAVLCWGTTPGFLLLGFAFLTHLTSTADVLRQVTFPGISRAAAYGSASLGLGIVVYGPALGLASAVAWPAFLDETGSDRLLVNRLSYRDHRPRAGDRVWIQGEGREAPVAAVVVEGPTPETTKPLTLFGLALGADGEADRGGFPAQFSLEVPEGHLLVRYDDRPVGGPAGQPCLRIVPERRVVGLVWGRVSTLSHPR